MKSIFFFSINLVLALYGGNAYSAIPPFRNFATALRLKILIVAPIIGSNGLTKSLILNIRGYLPDYPSIRKIC